MRNKSPKPWSAVEIMKTPINELEKSDKGVTVLFQDTAAISSYKWSRQKEWCYAMKIMRILSPSHIICASNDPRPIQLLDCTDSKGALQVAKSSFWSQKMRNVLKLIQNQFSDFFCLKKLFQVSGTDFSIKKSDDEFYFAPILMNIFCICFRRC